MAVIAVVATPSTYIASLGAITDAHARLGEAFSSNAALGDYARMETELKLASAIGGDIELAGGRRMAAEAGLAELSPVRLIYLPSFQVPDPDRLAERIGAFSALHHWLHDQSAQGVHIGACGASVFHLAAAGLLEGEACAVSPRMLGAFVHAFPGIDPDADNAIRRAGTAWSCSRDIDNAGLVARLFAESFSLSIGQGIALREPPGPASGLPAAPEDQVVARAQLWIRDRFTRRFQIADIAHDLGISHQSLIRRFRNAGSATPRDFVQRTRIDSAASMLTETSRTIAEIALLVGYTDVPSFRRVFKDLNGITPGAFRKTHGKPRG